MSTFDRSTHKRETIERAKRYFKESEYKFLRSSVISACGTMLFAATDAEMREIEEIVWNSAPPRRRRGLL